MLSSVRLTGAVALLLLPVFAAIEDNTGAELKVAATIDLYFAQQENQHCVKCIEKKPLFHSSDPKVEVFT
mgnify:FL=1